MIVSTRKSSHKYMDKHSHACYGIQKYLLSKKYIVSKATKHKVDEEQYKALLKEFCNQHPKWSEWKHRWDKETFIQKHFTSFANFCKNKFK